MPGHAAAPGQDWCVSLSVPKGNKVTDSLHDPAHHQSRLDALAKVC